MAKKKETTEAKEVASEAKVKPNPQGNIEERMAALLEDHKKMGAR